MSVWLAALVILPHVCFTAVFDVFMSFVFCFRIFAEGINWGRILTLLCFGYNMAIHVLRDHLGKFSEFLRRIGKLLLKFLVSERISQWIANNGGWVCNLGSSITVVEYIVWDHQSG